MLSDIWILAQLIDALSLFTYFEFYLVLFFLEIYMNFLSLVCYFYTILCAFDINWIKIFLENSHFLVVYNNTRIIIPVCFLAVLEVEYVVLHLIVRHSTTSHTPQSFLNWLFLR
jgi:hypothetical protein